jgi:hypothetical protein
MIQKHMRQVGFMALMTFATALLFACGGGGGGSDPVPPPNTPSSTSPKQVISSAALGRTVTNLVSQISKRISPIRTQSEINSSEINKTANIEETRACTNSGTSAIDMSWTGPEPRDVTDCSQVDDLEATLTLDACIENQNTQMEQSLTMTINKNGSLCAPDTMKTNVTNLRVIDTGDVALDLQSDSIQIETTEITNSSDDAFMTHVKMAMTGDANGTVNGVQYAAQFRNFVQVLNTEDNHQFVLDLSGDIKSDCMGQWATIETITPIRYKDQDCPTEGQVRITSGDKSDLVTYGADGAVTVGDTTYKSCRELEENCSG